MANAPLRFVRPNATELAVLLETGEVDFILEYESVARQYGFEFVALPRDMPAAVVYGLSIPRAAPDPRAATDFAMLVLSDRGKRLLRDAHLSALRTPVAVGANVPSEIADLVRTVGRPAEP
jgi:molybdate/tungstate transport system substrate-binding protein